MQTRLTRSTTDRMIAGVCGGLAEYFAIDPVIVRLIFALVTLSSWGVFGIPVYVAMWIIMPKAQPYEQRHQTQAHNAYAWGPMPGTTYLEHEPDAAETLRQPAGAYQHSHVRVADAPGQAWARADYPDVARFDPYTGQPLAPEAQTGQTVNLQADPADVAPGMPPAARTRVSQRPRNWRLLGIILIGIGALVMLETLGLAMNFVFPTLLIIAGVIVLLRRVR